MPISSSPFEEPYSQTHSSHPERSISHINTSSSSSSAYLHLKSRVERDRYLFSEHPREKLRQFIETANPVGVVNAIIHTLRLYVILDEYLRTKGLNWDSREIRQFQEEHAEELEREVNRAITSFICLIASQEG